MLCVMAFAGDHKDQVDMDSGQKMTCELKEGEACTSIKLSTAHCECGATEKMIGNALNGVEGVTMANVDVKNHMAHVHYTSADVQVADLENAVTTAGFDANDKKADKEAQSKLHACCAPESSK